MDETEYANMIAEVRAGIELIADALAAVPITPAPAPATRYVKRGPYMICCTCGMAKEYCPGHAQPQASTAQDGPAADSLERRVRDCTGKP